jgi:hypothetical protein
MSISDYQLAQTNNSLVVMTSGRKVVSAEYYGVSASATAAKVSVILPDGNPKRYFLKVRLHVTLNYPAYL